MARRAYPLAKAYALIEPGPVVLLTTAHGDRSNVMTLSWLMPMEFEPPLIGCVVSDRNYSYGLLQASREAVINIPGADLAEKVVACGNASGRDLDKFSAYGLTPRPASLMAAPLIAECWANLECRVVDTDMVPRYGLFVLEVVKAWVDRARSGGGTLHHQGYGVFATDGKQIRLPSRMK